MRGESVRRRIESMEHLPSLNQQNNAGSSGSSRAIENAYSFTWKMCLNEKKGPTESRDLSQPPVIRRMCHFFTFLLFVSCILLIVFPFERCVAITTSSSGLRSLYAPLCQPLWFELMRLSDSFSLGILGNRIVLLHVALIILIECVNLLTSHQMLLSACNVRTPVFGHFWLYQHKDQHHSVVN